MTVKQLRQKLEGVSDEVRVLIPVNQEFDGRFYLPCPEESGECEIGDMDEEDVKEAELLNKEIPGEKVFMLVPCGFHDEKDHTHELN